MDIETAFLESNVETDIYIELPKGLSGDIYYKTSIGKLNKSIYGSAEYDRLFYKKLKGILIDKMGVIVSKSDPWLLKKSKLIVALYVDDILIVGDEDDINMFVSKFDKLATVITPQLWMNFLGLK